MKSKEQGGILAQLNSAHNAVVTSEVLLIDRVAVVRQSLLECKSDRTLNERYLADGIHLSPKGVSYLASNWVSVIRNNYPDISKFSKSYQQPNRDLGRNGDLPSSQNGDGGDASDQYEDGDPVGRRQRRNGGHVDNHQRGGGGQGSGGSGGRGRRPRNIHCRL